MFPGLRFLKKGVYSPGNKTLFVNTVLLSKFAVLGVLAVLAALPAYGAWSDYKIGKIRNSLTAPCSCSPSWRWRRWRRRARMPSFRYPWPSRSDSGTRSTISTDGAPATENTTWRSPGYSWFSNAGSVSEAGYSTISRTRRSRSSWSPSYGNSRKKMRKRTEKMRKSDPWWNHSHLNVAAFVYL